LGVVNDREKIKKNKKQKNKREPSEREIKKIFVKSKGAF
jgi:hypothetical protein